MADVIQLSKMLCHARLAQNKTSHPGVPHEWQGLGEC